MLFVFKAKISRFISRCVFCGFQSTYTLIMRLQLEKPVVGTFCQGLQNGGRFHFNSQPCRVMGGYQLYIIIVYNVERIPFRSRKSLVIKVENVHMHLDTIPVHLFCKVQLFQWPQVTMISFYCIVCCFNTVYLHIGFCTLN